MNIQQFQYILAVAENRHFETAAEKCFISQSTLSTMISRFEDELGVKIFDRKKKPVDITKEGKAVIEQLKTITREIGQLNELVKEIKGEIEGTLKIGCIPTVAPFLLPLFLQGFSKKFPGLSLEVKEDTTSEILKQLKSREMDIGIVSTPLHDSELTEYPLYDEAFVLYDASQLSPQKIAVEKMNLDNFWLLEEGHCMRSQVLKICEKSKRAINPSQNIHFKAGSIDSLLRFVKANQGKTLLPYLSLSNFSEKEKEQVSFFKNPIPYRNIGLIFHKHFAKKKILHLLQKEIVEKIAPFKQSMKQGMK
ncbi:MAG: LysR family transcriptional regulator [Bacteroidetes bacterium]|nr:LysR family transcriptional regulator [Bacteroidota bacterium]MBS1540673.1 LysR family transcriptional regulator [Bacteroidota bacterium]